MGWNSSTSSRSNINHYNTPIYIYIYCIYIPNDFHSPLPIDEIVQLPSNHSATPDPVSQRSPHPSSSTLPRRWRGHCTPRCHGADLVWNQIFIGAKRCHSKKGGFSMGFSGDVMWDYPNAMNKKTICGWYMLSLKQVIYSGWFISSVHHIAHTTKPLTLSELLDLCYKMTALMIMADPIVHFRIWDASWSRTWVLHLWMGWFQGKSTGNPRLFLKKYRGFRALFPIDHFRERACHSCWICMIMTDQYIWYIDFDG